MPVQFPTLTTQEQNDRVAEISTQTLFPYSFLVGIDIATATFPFATPNITFFQMPVNYLSYAFQADNTLGIYAIQVALQFGLSAGPFVLGNVPWIVALSYSPILQALPISTATALDNPTVPSDRGSDIYKEINILGSPNYFVAGVGGTPILIDVYNRYTPNAYVLKFGQTLYIHIGLGSLLTNNPGAYTGSIGGVVILHTLQTGAKN